jgi:hypothetical protein
VLDFTSEEIQPVADCSTNAGDKGRFVLEATPGEWEGGLVGIDDCRYL